ncbi:hypothetical protein L9F63_008582 [Diploptera punctata]|uniref:EF-hand domain-containing protein n=1 Tax=Diploptera punctata TaxID=6984 RepID=A0AAD7Z545_DIPPU|nr:hypothetical protein L9F63_008582 [Diploptera punctata]
MADTIQPPKEKKKKKSEVKKSDLPAKTKGETNSVDAKEKQESRKPSLAAESASRKSSATPEESAPAPLHGLKAQVEVEEVEEKPAPKPRPILKVVADVEITETPEPPKLKPVATVEVEVESTLPERRASYVAPKAATRRDVDLLYDLDDQKLMELREAFHLFDLNNDGFIDKEDLKNTYITLGKTDIEDSEIQHMLSEAMNPLDFDAFVILLGYKSIELDPEEVLLEALSQWDYDDSGLISEDRIKHDLTMWGDKFTQEEVEVALEDAPVFVRGNTPMIDYVNFCKILCGLRKKPKMPQPGEHPVNK